MQQMNDTSVGRQPKGAVRATGIAMQTHPSRRALLRGMPKMTDFPRPYGAVMAFEAECSQCGDCARACPEAIILRDKAGYPAIDFSQGACSFCGDCIAACPTEALRAGEPFLWRATLQSGCLGNQCRACEDQCSAAAIKFRPALGGQALPQIDRDLCTGCGACVAPCPTAALTLTPFTGASPC